MPSLAVHMERSTNCQHGPTCMGATYTCQTVLDACWLATNLVMQRRAWMLLSLLQSGMQRPGISRVEAQTCLWRARGAGEHEGLFASSLLPAGLPVRGQHVRKGVRYCKAEV